MEYRGFRDDRVRTFDWKTYANYLLQQRVKRCADSHEYELLRQDWDHLNRPEYKDFKWHKKQLDAILAVEQGTSYEDEHERRQSSRYLYICGAPGSGKSAVILECAIRSAKKGIRVLIVCPTGLLVHQYKASLPDSEGVENVGVDTIQGVLKYKRPGPDGKVRWAPPSALRRIDLILVDEASQYDDREWMRFLVSVQEQPHKPFTAVVADFSQLQPVVSGGACRRFCEALSQRVALETVYRSDDKPHLLFCNRIRDRQPTRPSRGRK